MFGEVYPRVCGGTLPIQVVIAMLKGLSPRVRGEPSTVTAAVSNLRVYPRVCGGTRPTVSIRC